MADNAVLKNSTSCVLLIVNSPRAEKEQLPEHIRALKQAQILLLTYDIEQCATFEQLSLATDNNRVSTNHNRLKGGHV